MKILDCFFCDLKVVDTHCKGKDLLSVFGFFVGFAKGNQTKENSRENKRCIDQPVKRLHGKKYVIYDMTPYVYVYRGMKK